MGTVFSRAMALAVIGMMALLIGSGYAEQNENMDQNIEQSHYRKILLLPISNAVDIYGEGEVGTCRICGASYVTGPVMASAPAFLTENLRTALSKKKPITVISEEHYRDLRSRILLLKPDGVSEKEIMMTIGAELDADAILTGSVYRFQERIGSDYAAESPASIGFGLDLIETKTGSIRWSRRFEDTQRALSENLFSLGAFIKRKARWVSAEDLALEAIERVLETIPIQNENEK
ncbi:MAG: hypothetical protein RBT11_04415 [Desulfobacterales bacterium]|nr:hypothetical protein [Desulfobacterales bacterium]